MPMTKLDPLRRGVKYFRCLKLILRVFSTNQHVHPRYDVRLPLFAALIMKSSVGILVRALRKLYCVREACAPAHARQIPIFAKVG